MRMACNPIFIYSDNNCKKATAGVAQLYLISYYNLKEVNGEVYTVGNNGMVNTINFENNVIKFVKIGVLPKSASMKNNYVYNESTGVSEFNEELSFPIINISNTSRKIVKLLRSQPVVCLVKFSTGTWFALGLNGQMHLTTNQGINDSNFNGYNLTFNGVANDYALIVDPSIIPNIIADQPAPTSNIFTRVFNRIFR